MDGLVEFVRNAWSAEGPYGLASFGLIALAYLALTQGWRLKRCEHCGGRYKKVYDNMLVERITDALLPRRHPDKEYAVPTFVCRRCNVEKPAR